VRSNSTPIRVADPGSVRGAHLRRLNTAPGAPPRVSGGIAFENGENIGGVLIGATGRAVEQRMPNRIATGLRGLPAVSNNDSRNAEPVSSPVRGSIRRPSLGSSGPIQTPGSKLKNPRLPMPRYEEEEEEEEDEEYASDEYDGSHGSSIVPDMTVMVKVCK
jgi:hypothetical protein